MPPELRPLIQKFVPSSVAAPYAAPAGLPNGVVPVPSVVLTSTLPAKSTVPTDTLHWFSVGVDATARLRPTIAMRVPSFDSDARPCELAVGSVSRRPLLLAVAGSAMDCTTVSAAEALAGTASSSINTAAVGASPVAALMRTTARLPAVKDRKSVV